LIEMALDKTIKVPLPERGIIKYKSKDTVYVYYITRVYRNENGKPTNDRVSIGKIDKETGMQSSQQYHFLPSIFFELGK